MSFDKTDNRYHGYIYKICNTENNKVYIGQTRRDLNIRWKEHLNDANSGKEENKILYRAMRKYGVDKFYILLIKEYAFNSKTELMHELDREEIMYISQYHSMTPNGYNMQSGGISSSDNMKQPIDKYSNNGILIKSYESITDACVEDGNLNRSHISECCKGKLCTSGGFVWRFKGDPFDKYHKIDKRTASVDVYSKDGILIGSYQTCMDAIYELFNDTNHKKYNSHIASCCQGKRKTAYGFVWRYAGESFEKIC